MIQIVNHPKEKRAFPKELIYTLLGESLEDQPGSIRKVLLESKILCIPKEIIVDSDAKELVELVLFGIEKNSPWFEDKLARILSKQWRKEDNFIPEGSVEGAEITVGSDPVSAIAGALGSIANIFGNFQQKKMAKSQARNETLRSLINYRQSGKEKEESQTSGSFNYMPIIIGVSIVALITGGVLIYKSAKS